MLIETLRKMGVAEDFRELADQIDKSGDFPFHLHLAKNSSTWGSLAWCCHPNTVGRGVTINLNGVGGRLNVRGRLPLERLEETAAIMERALAGRVRRVCRRALGGLYPFRDVHILEDDPEETITRLRRLGSSHILTRSEPDVPPHINEAGPR